MIVCSPRRANRFFAILVAAIVFSHPGCSVAPVTAQTAAPPERPRAAEQG